MTLQQFIKEHKVEIDIAIRKTTNTYKNNYPSNAERRLWILNDERLYNWARSEGVRI